MGGPRKQATAKAVAATPPPPPPVKAVRRFGKCTPAGVATAPPPVSGIGRRKINLRSLCFGQKNPLLLCRASTCTTCKQDIHNYDVHAIGLEMYLYWSKVERDAGDAIVSMGKECGSCLDVRTIYYKGKTQADLNTHIEDAYSITNYTY